MFNPTPTGTERVVATTNLRPGDIFRPHAGVTYVLIAASEYGTQQNNVVAYSLNTGERASFEVARRVSLVDFGVLPHCDICERGCDCTGGSPGCAHFSCWGVQSADADRCPGALAQCLDLYRGVALRRAVTA
jgi:hypothetical protein